VRHEQTAGHAADGYARVTGKPGVALVTAGPGVTDVVTAVANAQRAGVPMIVIGGAGPTVFKHMGSLQDMDHVELMRPITKWSASVTEMRRLEEYVTMAFRIAQAGAGDAPRILMVGRRRASCDSPGRAGDQVAIRAIDAAAKLRREQRPMFIWGRSFAGRPSPKVRALADAIEAPLPAAAAPSRSSTAT
jgi:acetolactate synthase-1/2/3 large subunit